MLRPDSIEQMIQVLVRFRDKYSRSYNIDKAHIEAITEVAEKWQISKQTVQDMCWRRLNLSSVSNFRNLLEKWMLGDPEPLLEHLKKFTPSRFHREIEAILKEHKTTTSLKSNLSPIPTLTTQRLDENFSFSIDSETAKKMKVLSLMNSLSTPDWLRKIMTDVINKEYEIWLNKQRATLSKTQGEKMKTNELEKRKLIGENVFIFSACSREAEEHFERTVRNGISLDQIFNYIKEDTIREKLEAEYNKEEKKAYLWAGKSLNDGTGKMGNDENYWNKMDCGDLILVYKKKSIIAVSYVVEKVKNAALGEHCWPNPERPYDLIYFIGKPKNLQCPVPLDKIKDKDGNCYFGKIYQGLRKVEDSHKILKDYGSLKNFVKEVFGENSIL